jgi:hypothetical protein
VPGHTGRPSLSAQTIRLLSAGRIAQIKQLCNKSQDFLSVLGHLVVEPFVDSIA